MGEDYYSISKYFSVHLNKISFGIFDQIGKSALFDFQI